MGFDPGRSATDELAMQAVEPIQPMAYRMWSELLVEGHVEVEKHRLACRCTTIDALHQSRLWQQGFPCRGIVFESRVGAHLSNCAQRIAKYY
jgi:hypothetical protein